MNDYLTRTNNGTSFTGSDVNIYRCIVIASALRLYARTGLKANRAYTPRNMLAAATAETGRTFTGRDKYMQAAAALDARANAAKSLPRRDSSAGDTDGTRDYNELAQREQVQS